MKVLKNNSSQFLLNLRNYNGYVFRLLPTTFLYYGFEEMLGENISNNNMVPFNKTFKFNGLIYDIELDFHNFITET